VRPELPRRHWVRIAPQSAPVLSRFDLSALVSRLHTGRIFSDVFLVDLLEVDISAGQQDHSQEAAVVVSAEDVQLDITAKDVLAQVLFSRLSKSLAFFGGVDIPKADT
jgi:hypothetical protein